MYDVAIVGVGQSVFSRNSGTSTRELGFEAFKEAMNGLKISKEDIDASVISYTPEYDKQRTPSALVTEYLELVPKPTFNVETACSSSTTGLHVAWALVKSGLYKIVVIVGIQKMSELTSREVAEIMGRGADVMWESPFGLGMPSGHALYACAHMAKYGTTEAQLAKIRVKNSHYAVSNPKATYRKEVTLEEVLNSEAISSPLKKFDCCANADGASCVIIASKDVAKEITDKPIWIAGIGSGSNTMSLSGRDSHTSFLSTREAAKRAYGMAGVGPADIDVAEVHDCFTIAEILAYEDLGFAKPGEGPRLIDERGTYLEGRIPVNVDGGLLCKGHPIGATGGSQIRTIVRQLRGEAVEAQVKNAEIGLAHNVGGIGHYAFVTILRR